MGGNRRGTSARTDGARTPAPQAWRRAVHHFGARGDRWSERAGGCVARAACADADGEVIRRAAIGVCRVARSLVVRLLGRRNRDAFLGTDRSLRARAST